LIEAARTILDKYKTPDIFWAEAINTACHAFNRLYLRKYLGKTPYEIITGKKSKVHYFRVFRSKYFILNKKTKSLKFASKMLMKAFYSVMVLTNTHVVYSTKPPVVLRSWWT
jgi:hypothetical protein